MLFYNTIAFAQVGRVEQTVDSVPVGGQEQREQVDKMQAHDRLKEDLEQLRDSVNQFILGKEKHGDQHQTLDELKTLRSELSALLNEFAKTDASADLAKRGYESLDKTRKEFQILRHRDAVQQR